MRRQIIGMLVIVLMTVATVGSARGEEEDLSYGREADLSYGREADLSYGSQAGWGLAAAGANLFYIPAKVAYVTVACLTGGLVYAVTLGNIQAVEAIFSPGLGGTYVITPAMIRGDEPIFFFGESLPG